MSYAAHRLNFGAGVDSIAPAPAVRCPPTKGDTAHGAKPGIFQRGIFQRLGDVIRLSRQRQVDREIAAYLARSGGLITDSVERDMQRYISTTGWSRSCRS